MLSTTLSRVRQNDLAALKLFFDSGGDGIGQYVNAIEYTYDITPQIFASDTSKNVTQVNPDFMARAMGMGSNSSLWSSFGMTTSVFNPLIEDTSILKGQYDLVAGKWPEKHDELVVVLTHRGSISDYTLYLMGLRDPAELEDMLHQFQNEEVVTAPSDRMKLTYEEILAVTFKLVPASKFYTYDETFGVWTNRETDAEYMKKIVEEGETLKIVGILKENPDATAAALNPGIYYPASLTYHLMDLAAESEIVKKQLANQEVNIITGKTFEEEKKSSGFSGFGMDDLMTIDEDALSNAFDFDASFLNIDLSGVLNPSNLTAAMPAMPELSLVSLLSLINIDIPMDDLVAVTTDIINEYMIYCFMNGLTTTEEIIGGFPAYLSDPLVQERLYMQLSTALDVQEISNEIQGVFTWYIQQTMQAYMISVISNMMWQIQAGLTGMMQQISDGMATAMSFNPDVFANAFQFNINEEELSHLIMTLMSTESNTYENNLRKFGYANRDKPSSISIYPKDFASKQGVLEILDNYNQKMLDAGTDDKVITYTDFVGVLMSSVTDIVNVISYVLVTFVAISLVVSSIMIGVITYISVLERRKEIGILRAIGARKGDIGNVFTAETLIVGFTAGLMGVLVTLLLTIPANYIVEMQFGVSNIAILPWEPAVILVAISMVLSFVAGLIPSSAASRRDPVEALRSD